jgi:hypothetical protein
MVLVPSFEAPRLVDLVETDAAGDHQIELEQAAHAAPGLK